MKYLKRYNENQSDDDFDPFGHLVTKNSNNFFDKTDKFLHISTSNAKLKFPYLSLPSGYTCPFADACKTLTNRHGQKFTSTNKTIMDMGQFRCYSASAESRYTKVRDNRWENYDMLKAAKTVGGMSELLVKSIRNYKMKSGNFLLFRIHEAGDFFSQVYFDAWIKTCNEYPEVKFYAYTKSLPFWVARLNSIPSNLKLIASKGGTYDEMIAKYNLRYADVVNSVEEAKEKRLRIDVDDSLAYSTNDNFALLLHGGQKEKTVLGKQSYKNAAILRDAKNKLI